MAYREYVGSRYVPIFGRKDETTIEWDNSKPYEPLTIVLYQGNSYTSRQYVPIGVDIANTDYWANTGNYNAQIDQYRQEVSKYNMRIETLEGDFPVSSANIADGAITASKIATGAVESSKIANGAVTVDKIANSSVESSKIANGAVGSSQIAAGAVGASQIANGAVGSSQIANGAVGADQIATGAITADKIASGASITYRDVIADDSAQQINIAANSFGIFTADIPVITGYTPIGILQFEIISGGSLQLLPYNWEVNTNTNKMKFSIANVSSSQARTNGVYARVIYMPS